MRYTFYRFFSRKVVLINIILSLLYFGSFIFLFYNLTLYPEKSYYIQSINGFMFPIKSELDPQKAELPQFAIE